jgi:alpha-L-fucosidase
VVKAGNFNEERLKYTSADIRFTMKGNHLYAFCLDVPKSGLLIRSLGRNAHFTNKRIASISMLGNGAPLLWHQNDDALVITLPTNLPDWKVLGFNISLQ